MNIRFLTYLDTANVLVGLAGKRDKLFDDNRLRQDAPGSPHHDTRTILLREPSSGLTEESWFADEEYRNTPTLNEWEAAKALLQRARAEAAKMGAANGVALSRVGKAMVVDLKPQGWIDWHRDEGAYAENHARFHVALRTNPGCVMYSGGEAAHLPVGHLYWLDVRQIHAAVNFGLHRRVHLIFDLRIERRTP